MTLNYFGTDLDSAGHYFWTLSENSLYRSRVDQFKLPFNAEYLPWRRGAVVTINGSVAFEQFAGFSILAIVGSPKDKRPGSKSIFFIERELSKEKFITILLTAKIARQILKGIGPIRWEDIFIETPKLD